MKIEEEDDVAMREEYDFSNAIRNPFTQHFKELNLVSLDNDVRAVFPDSDAVNRALRLVIDAAKKAVEFPKAS